MDVAYDRVVPLESLHDAAVRATNRAERCQERTAEGGEVRNGFDLKQLHNQEEIEQAPVRAAETCGGAMVAC